MKKIILSLSFLLLLTTGCSLSAVSYAPAIDPNAPAAVKVHVIRNRTTFFAEQDSGSPWVVGIDERSLCQLNPGQYAVLDTTEGDAHWVTVMRHLGWWHKEKEPFVAEPDTDYYFLTGVQENSIFIKKIDATTAAAYLGDSTQVCGQTQPVKTVAAVPEPPIEAAPPPVEKKEDLPKKVVVAPPPPPKPVMEKPEPTGVKVKEIYFDLDKADIKKEMYDDLDAVVQYLNSHPSIVVVLGGYACELGTDQHNLALSKRRNDAVRSYLVKAGIKSDRIREEAFGEADPEYDNATEEGRRHNRRVEFKFVPGS